MLPSRVSRVVCSSLEFSKTQILNEMLSRMIMLAPNNDKIENNSFSGLDLLRHPPWSVLSLEAILAPVVCAASPGHGKV